MSKQITKRQEELRDRMSKLTEMGIILNKVIEYPNYYKEYNAEELKEEYQELFSETVLKFG